MGSKLEYLNGNLQTESLPGSKHKKLLRTFIVLDPKRRLTWTAPKDMVTDGKSIPPGTSAFIGDPFEGVTSEAAVIHDYFCKKENQGLRTQKETHEIFRKIVIKEMRERYNWFFRWTWQYQRAWLMWAAVRAYNRIRNPKWK